VASPPILKDINFVQYNPAELYTPSGSQTKVDESKLTSLYGSPNAAQYIYIGPDKKDTKGLLTPERLGAVYDVWYLSSYGINNYTASVYVEDGSNVPIKISLQDLCLKGQDDVCTQSSILSFWDYNRTLIESQTSEEMWETVVNKNFVAVEPSGGVTKWNDSVSMVDGVVAATQLYSVLESKYEKLIGAQDDDPKVKDLDAQNLKWLNFNETWKESAGISVQMWGLSNQFDENERAVAADGGLIPIGFIVVFCYAAVVLTTNNSVHSHGSLAALSFMCSGITIITTWGLGCWLGIQFSLVVRVTAFLIVGLGFDDSFVLVAAFQDPKIAKLETNERIKQALASAGASITVTTLTDLFAFLIGSITDVPAIQAFCYYAAIGVSVNYLFQITAFVGFMKFSSDREKAGRFDWFPFCLFKAANPEKNFGSEIPYDPDADPIMTKFCVSYSKVLLRPVTKAVVLVSAVVLVGFSAWGTASLELDFDLEWFTPPDSYMHDVNGFREEHFGAVAPTVKFYTFNVPYHTQAVQEQLNDLSGNISASESTKGECANWWVAYRQFAATDPSNITTSYGVESSAFNASLTQFLAHPMGYRFKSSIVYAEDNVTVLATSIRCSATPIEDNTMLNRIDRMNTLRDMAESFEALGPAMAFSSLYVFYEGLEDVRAVILTNIGLAIATVFVVGMITLGNLSTGFLVFLMIVCIDLELMALIYVWGGYFNYVTGINFVLAVGLSVDACVHICHSFLSADGTGDERAAHALKHLGRSVLNGLISTTLILVPFFIAAQSYIFITFYKCITGIMLFSGLNGLVVLPVLLSLVKPTSYNEAKAIMSKENKKASDGEPQEDPNCFKTSDVNPVHSTAKSSSHSQKTFFL